MGANRIFKYPLIVTDQFSVPMPEGAKLLTVQMQHGEPMVWALVDPDTPARPIRFRIYGTGNPVDEPGLTYLGSFQMHDGALVFHVFYEAPCPNTEARDEP